MSSRDELIQLIKSGYSLDVSAERIVDNILEELERDQVHHSYPFGYDPTQEAPWYMHESYRVLDLLHPAAMSRSSRSFLAGALTAALLKAESKGRAEALAETCRTLLQDLIAGSS